MPKKHGYTNSLHSSSQRINIASIVQRLPLQQRLSQSQAALVKLSPAWLLWSTNHLNKSIIAQVSLSSLQNGELVISCANAVCASQIKHQQAHLLDSLVANGVTNVKRIKVRIEHASINADHQNNVLAKQRRQSKGETNTRLTPTSRNKPSLSTIKSIEHCQKLTSNNELSDSLKRLAHTLNDLEPQS